MKRLVMSMAVAIVLFGGSQAFAGILNSKHDIPSNATYAGSSTEICKYCHIPHNPVEAYPLWNRSAPAGAVTTYNSSTIDMNRQTNAFGISLKCLSCHDGSSGTTSGGTADVDLGNNITGNANLGTNLVDTHPISIYYSTTADTDFFDISAGPNNVKLYDGGYVQCASCHDPHKTTYGKFLRTSNDASALCLTCHNK